MWLDPLRSGVTLREYSQAWLAERTIRGRPLAVRTRETRQHSLDRWVLPGIGRTHARTHVLLLLLVQDLHVRVVHATTGELPRELTIDPTRDHQPTGRPPGPTGK